MPNRRPRLRTIRDSAGVKGIRWGDNRDPIETRIGRVVEPQPDGCWIFRGNPDCYGQFMDGFRGPNISVHRFVYETLIGPIPEGHHLHHRCHTRGCCNPEHLVPLTPGEHKRLHWDEKRAAS